MEVLNFTVTFILRRPRLHDTSPRYSQKFILLLLLLLFCYDVLNGKT